jgi:hypothetical protein
MNWSPQIYVNVVHNANTHAEPWITKAITSICALAGPHRGQINILVPSYRCTVVHIVQVAINTFESRSTGLPSLIANLQVAIINNRLWGSDDLSASYLVSLQLFNYLARIRKVVHLDLRRYLTLKGMLQ